MQLNDDLFFSNDEVFNLALPKLEGEIEEGKFLGGLNELTIVDIMYYN